MTIRRDFLYPLRVEEVAPDRHKTSLRIDRATGDQAMQVNVLAETLPPGVQHCGHAKLALELAVTSTVIIEAFPDTAKQAMVNHFRVALDPAIQIMRQGKYQVIVGHW